MRLAFLALARSFAHPGRTGCGEEDLSEASEELSSVPASLVLDSLWGLLLCFLIFSYRECTRIALSFSTSSGFLIQLAASPGVLPISLAFERINPRVAQKVRGLGRMHGEEVDQGLALIAVEEYP